MQTNTFSEHTDPWIYPPQNIVFKSFDILLEC